MSSALIDAFTEQMVLARSAYHENDIDKSFHCLERAHILGQRFLTAHLITHWWMLKVGIRRADKKEVFGQIIRLIACFPGYFFGWIPKGNTGGANVSPIKPMPIPKELEPLFSEHKFSNDIIIRVTLWLAIGAMVWPILVVE